MWTATFEAYMMFRMTESEHIASYKRKALPTYPKWVEESPNPSYERHLWDSDPHNRKAHSNG